MNKRIRFLKNFFSREILFLIILSAILMLLVSFISVYPNEYLKLAINSIDGEDIYQPLIWASVYLGFRILQVLVSMLKQKLNFILSNKLTLDARYGLFGRVLHLPMKYLDSQKPGELVSKIQSADAIVGAILDPIHQVLSIGSKFIFALYFSFRLQLTLSIVIYVMLLPPMLGITKLFSKRIYNLSCDERKAEELYMSHLVNAISIGREIKLLRCHDRFLSRFKEISTIAIKSTARFFQTKFFISAMTERIPDIGMWFIIGYGGFLIVNGQWDLGSLVAFMSYSGIVFNNANSVVKSILGMQRVYASIDRGVELFNLDQERQDGLDLESFNKLDIEFRNVSFSYDGEQFILKDLCLQLKQGASLYIVGPSGIGKSTIIKLLLGLYLPTKGIIKIAGINILEINPNSLRKSIGVVVQESVLLNDTVIENIRISRPTASVDEVKKVAREADAENFILKMPKGYETILGEGERFLSVGQKQRIAIARILLQDPSIIIFDEPTSGLDVKSASRILSIIENKLTGKTKIVITHDLNSIPKNIEVLKL